jgi:hypothetical protein
MLREDDRCWYHSCNPDMEKAASPRSGSKWWGVKEGSELGLAVLLSGAARSHRPHMHPLVGCTPMHTDKRCRMLYVSKFVRIHHVQRSELEASYAGERKSRSEGLGELLWQCIGGALRGGGRESERETKQT